MRSATRTNLQRAKSTYRRRLRAEILEDRHMLATVTWDGGGDDLSWHNAANWDVAGIDGLPGPNDDVVINGTSGIVLDQAVTISLNSLVLQRSNINVTASRNFVIHNFLRLDTSKVTASDGGQLTINSPEVSGFNAASFEAEGIGSSISLNNTSILSGPSVSAMNGAHISLPDLIDTYSTTKFLATGGSRLSLGTSGPASTLIRGEVRLDDSEVFGDGLEISQLLGNGTINGDLVVTNEIRPDSTLNVTGDLRGSSSGRTMVIRYSGPGSSAYLNVGGTAALSGFRVLILVPGGFTPDLGESFEFLTATSTVGDPSTIADNVTSAAGMAFSTSATAGVVSATAIPNPGGLRVHDIDVNSLSEALQTITIDVNRRLAADTVSADIVSLENEAGPISNFSVEYQFFDQSIRIRLDTPVPAGVYTLTIDPTITDENGNLLNQDGDEVDGEPVEDAYITEIAIVDNDGPFVVHGEETTFGRGPITQLRFLFTTPTDVNSFTPDDLVVVNANGEQFDPQPIIEVNSDGTSYIVTFQNPITEEGEYEIRLGPGILDVSGNPMDQNEDGILGDPLLDTYVIESEVKIADPVPDTPGNGAFTELFLGVAESFFVPFGNSTESMSLPGRSPDAAAIMPAIDFPNSAEFVSVRNSTVSDFFSGTFPLTEEQGDHIAGAFMLRNTFYLAVTAEADLYPDTPEIDIRTGVGSDDGYILGIDGSYVSHSDDRSWRYTWDEVTLRSPGLYPVELTYSANAGGQSGLEFAWETATSGGEQIVPTEFLYFDNSLLFAGDADLNGVVNSIDLGLLLNNFNDDSGLSWQGGNFNGDMFVDSTDLGLLLNNFGRNESLTANRALANAAFAEFDAEDTGSDRIYTPIDALRIINHLNQPGNLTDAEHDALDFDGNGEIVPLDALMVINRLNAQQGTADITESDALQIRAAAIQHVIDTSFYGECNISNPCESDPRRLVFLAVADGIGGLNNLSEAPASLLDYFSREYDVAQFSDGEVMYNGYHLINEDIVTELDRGPLYYAGKSIRRIDGTVEVDAGSYLGSSGATSWTLQLQPAENGWEITGSKLNWIS